MFVQCSILISIFCWTLVISSPYEYSSLKRSRNSRQTETLQNNGDNLDFLNNSTNEVEDKPSNAIVSSSVHLRKRRATSTCTLKEYYVKTELLGHVNSTHKEINIGACVGECHITYTSFNSNYSNIRYMSFKKKGKPDNMLPKESWVPTCQITGTKSINLFFEVTVGNQTIVEEKIFENMVVTSCGCRNNVGIPEPYSSRKSHTCQGNNKK